MASPNKDSPMRYSIFALTPFLLLASACQQTDSHDSAPASSVKSQIARGAVVFGDNCATCHGDKGQGKKAPPLVGPGALPLNPRPDQKLRTMQFRTAMDVAKFVTTNMPPDADDRRKIPESDYWAVLAFDLDANGVKLKDPVSPANAGSIVLHP
jgi:S-disulfanyl-L-cysteine oxidoreductase SoxD